MLAIATTSPTPSVSLAANLFSSCGKLAVKITSLGDDRALVTASERPEAGSFAYLVRNGLRLPALVAWTQGNQPGLSFEEPVDDTRLAQMVSGKR